MTDRNYRVPSLRAPNAICANPQRLSSEMGMRYALGRNVKRSLPNHRFDSVEVWTLKQRKLRPDGSFTPAVTVKTHCTRAEAEAWVEYLEDGWT